MFIQEVGKESNIKHGLNFFLIFTRNLHAEGYTTLKTLMRPILFASEHDESRGKKPAQRGAAVQKKWSLAKGKMTLT